jgi:hypothetical protein
VLFLYLEVPNADFKFHEAWKDPSSLPKRLGLPAQPRSAEIKCSCAFKKANSRPALLGSAAAVAWQRQQTAAPQPSQPSPRAPLIPRPPTR